MSKYEQSVYNTWLSTVRQQSNKPYRLRKDFTKLDDESKNYVKKIASKLRRLNIPLDEFFVAPFKFWDDTKHMPLHFYTSQKALIAWKKTFANQ
jgi:hypothetical protein|tara:strand:- start:125 stop:406 length:282 start_codon:yes stop_codon:yes gene_type:complete